MSEEDRREAIRKFDEAAAELKELQAQYKNEPLLHKGQQVRVKADAHLTLYKGRVGTITEAFRDMEGQPRYMVVFDAGGGSVYHADELEVVQQEA